MSREEKKIELRSEEIQEILGKPPKWLIRYGISIIFIVIAGLFVGSYFFKYPDIITATINVTTENLPAEITAKTTGRIDSVFVKEKEYVNKGDIIAMIDNTASLYDVLLLKRFVSQFSINNNTSIDSLIKGNLNLGSLQESFFVFLKSYTDYRTFIETDYYNKKANIARKQLKAQEILVRNLKRQLLLDEQSFNTSKELFSMDSALFSQKALSLSDFENSKNTFIKAQQSLESSKINIDNQRVSILELEKNILELEKQYTDNLTLFNISLNGAFEALSNEINLWEKTYLFIAPTSGVVTMTKYWQKNQNISAGEIFASVVPKEPQKIIGKILLPLKGAGKVKVGQDVNVKFDSYPYMEYGLVRVKVKSISLVPIKETTGSYYMLEVDFPNKLITNYKKELQFSQHMTGTAEIVTEDMRLIDKLLNPIKAIINK